MKFEFIKHYYETILTIIEDKPKYELPLAFYKTLMFISYLQIFIYLFSPNETKILDDLKVEAIAKIIQMISIKNILSLKDSNNWSFVVYIIVNGFMYGYFIYVCIHTIFKHYLDSYYEKNKKIFISINQILNMYFALFVQIFFTQYVELNSSILFCSKRSLFVEQRISDDQSNSQCSIPIWQTILGSFGLILTLLTAWITIYFFRNYEFMEYNLIKRRTSTLFFILILLKFIITVLFFAGQDNEEYIKHLLSQAIGVVSLIDYFINYPYSDTRVGKFYLKIISWYYVLVIMTHIWIFTQEILSNELFYFSLLFGLIIESFFQGFDNYRYDFFLHTEVKIGYLPVKLDIYLEELVRLSADSTKDELSKIKLYKLVKSHQQSCENTQCPCHQLDSNLNQQDSQIKGKLLKGNQTQNNNKIDKKENKTSNNNKNQKDNEKVRRENINKNNNEADDQQEKKEGEISFEQVLSIVDSIFKFFLSQHVLNKNQIEYEHLSLKYITFMIKYLKNYTRSNYELKLLQFKREDFSQYFKIIAKIISNKIQIVIEEMNSHLELRRKDELTVKQLTSVDQITLKYIPHIIKVMNEKQKLWDTLQKGYRNMNQFQNDSLKLMKLIQVTKYQFFKDMHVIRREQNLHQSFQFQKLFLIFYLFVLNDNLIANELENLVQDLRKRDSLKEIDTLSNENFLRENIITISISLSQSLGKIVSKKDEKTANFFGYSKQDFYKITKVNELMPTYIGKVHDNIVKSFVNSGESQYIKSSKFVYAKDQTGFIIPVKLYLDFSFTSQNDFQVNGTLLKINQTFDYIQFHRTGKVVGITSRISQFLLSNSLQKGNKMPSGEFISNNLNVHLLLPKIAKRIFKRKEQIMQSIRSDGEIMISDRKGQILVTNNPLLSIKKLQSYIIRMNQSTSLQRKVGSSEAFDNIDLFHEKSYEIVDNFRRQEVDNSSAAGLSSGRLSGKISNKSVVSKGSSIGRDHQKYKIRFNYSLSYNCISQSQNSEQDLYFQLKMSDVNLVKVKEKQKSSFRMNLIKYLLSTSLICKLDLKYKHLLNGSPCNDASKLSQQGDWFFSDEDIPNKLLKLAIQNDNMIKQMNEDQQKELKNELDQENENEQKKQVNFDSSDDENDDNYYEEEQEEEEEEQINIEKLRNKKKILDQYEENAKHQELNEVLQNYQFKENDILELDPNFKVKKVLQFKSLSSAFSRALEKAVVEALLENQQEKSFLFSQQNDDQNILDYSTFRENKPLQDFATFREFNTINSGQFKFQEQNTLKPNNKDNVQNQAKQQTNVKNKKTEKKEINTTQQQNQPKQEIKQQPQRNSQEISLQKNSKQEQNLISHQTIQDNSMQPSYSNIYINNEVHLDMTADNLVSYKNPETTNYFGTSARPFFQKQEQHDELNFGENETLVTPSIIDNQKPTQFSNSVTYQNALAKKERENNSNQQNQPQNHRPSQVFLKSLDMNKTVSDKYRSSSNLEMFSSVHQKESPIPNQPQQQKNQQQSKLTNQQKEQLQGGPLKSDQTKVNDEEVDDQSGKLHEKVVVQILNQKGLIADGSINKGSIHSSSKSSTKYGGNFLKGNQMSIAIQITYSLSQLLEIIKMRKIPKHSYHFSFLLIFFIVVFMCLNITNLMIIQNDMQYFSDNVIVLRQPRKFLRCYGKALFGKIINFEIETGLLQDKTGNITKTANFYILDGLTEYFSLAAQFQRVITDFAIQLQKNLEIYNRTVDVYQQQEKFQQQIDFALSLQNHLFFVIGVQNNQTKKMQSDSYLYLRGNFFQLSTDILNFGSFLVNNALNTVDNLILKFIAIAISAIFGVILVSIISLPIIRLINLYEEKILMIVSRINFDQSQVEKLKLNICSQLIDIDQFDWLKYNYTNITGLRFDQFDANVVNSQHDIQKAASSRKGTERINASNMIKMQQEMLNSNTKRSTTQTKNTPNTKETSQKQQANQKSKVKQSKIRQYDDGNSSYRDYQMSMKNSINKNFVLQSKIINQKLSIFQRFIPLFILTICNTIYFLVIIIYLQESNDLLKIPVLFNGRTIQYHITQTTLKLSAELLTFNDNIEQVKFDKIKSIDIGQYQDKMNDMIDLSIKQSQQNTELIYGSNPFPDDILNKFKDFEEGRICQYLVKFKCNQSEVGNKYSKNFMLSEKLRTIKTYPTVITKNDSQLTELISYSNSQDHLDVFINSFLIEDEVIDLYSSAANQSIGTISTQVQNFLQQYLQIFGNLFGLTIMITCIFTWRNLYQRLQHMNLLLTFIPEEKLLEEVTLQMLKSLRRM